MGSSQFWPPSEIFGWLHSSVVKSVKQVDFFWFNFLLLLLKVRVSCTRTKQNIWTMRKVLFYCAYVRILFDSTIKFRCCRFTIIHISLYTSITGDQLTCLEIKFNINSSLTMALVVQWTLFLIAKRRLLDIKS